MSESADTLSKSVQEQFNQVVIDGDSSVEAAQARVDANGQTNPSLKARLDKEYNEVTTQLAQTSYEATRKRKLEDLEPEVLSAIEGGDGTTFNLLSIPQDDSGTPNTTTFYDVKPYSLLSAVPDADHTYLNYQHIGSTAFIAVEPGVTHVIEA